MSDKFKALLIFVVLVIAGAVSATMTDGIYIMTVSVGGVIGGLIWGKTLFQKDMEGVKHDEHERIARLMDSDTTEDTHLHEQNYAARKRYR